MLKERYRLSFKQDGKVEVIGLDQPDAELWKGDADARIVVLKVPGRSYWSGRGMRGYAGAQFWVLERGDDGWFRPIVEFPVRKG